MLPSPSLTRPERGLSLRIVPGLLILALATPSRGPGGLAAEEATKATEPARAQEKAPAELENDPLHQEFLKINYIFNRELYDLAIPRYEKLLEAGPPRPEFVHYALALCHYNLALKGAPGSQSALPEARGSGLDAAKKAHLKEAISHFKEAIKRRDFESRVSATRALAECFLLQGDHENAAKAFQWVVDRKPPPEEEIAARMGLADSLYFQEKHAQAAAAYRDVLKRASAAKDMERAQFYLAMSLFRAGESPDESGGIFKKIAAQASSPYGADALYMSALWHQARGEDAEAAGAFRKLMQSGGGTYAELGQFGLATACFRSGRYQEAAEALTRFISAFPGSERKDQASLYLARALLETKDAAASRMLQDLSTSPSVGDEASLWFARLCVRDGKNSTAVSALKAALEAFPQSPRKEDLDLELCAASIGAADFDGALEILEGFQASHPDSSAKDHAAYLRAYALHRLKRYDDSLGACGQFESAFPQSRFLKEVVQLQAENLLLKGKHEEAVAAYRSSYSRFEKELDGPAKLKAQFRAAQALYLSKKPGEAAEALKAFGPARFGPEAEKAFAEDPVFATYRYILGDCAYQLKNYEEATRELKGFLDALEAKPKEGLEEPVRDARFKLAHSLQLAGNLPAARDGFLRAMELDPDSPHREQIQFELGQIAYSRKELDEAGEAFRKVVSQYPSSRFAPYALRFLGWMAMERKEYATAAEHYGKIVESFPDHPIAAEAEYQLAVSLQAAAKPDEAREVLRRFREKHPGDPKTGRLLLEEAAALSKAKKHREALEALQKLQRDPGLVEVLPSILYEIAWCHREMNDPDAAASAYREILAIPSAGPMGETARLELAELELDRKDHAAAKALLLPLAAAQGPQREKALYRLVWCHHLLKEHDGTLSTFEVFQKDFAASPLLGELSLLAAKAHMEKGSRAKAKDIFKAIAEGPADREETQAASVSYGECLLEEREFDAARQQFAAFLARHPSSKLAFRAHFGMGWADENSGKIEKAMESYRNVVKETATSTAARAQFQIGQCLAAKKEYRDAIVEFLQVPASFSYPEWSAKAILQVAGCFEALGEKANAKKYYEEVARSYPDRDEAKLARERLTKLEIDS